MRWLLALVLLLSSATLATPPAVVMAPEPITSEDRCKAWVIWDEARGESLKGARAVLDVVHTRMTRRDMTACEVVKERYQFQGYKPGVTKKVAKEALTLYEAVRRMAPVAAECEYFHATYVKPWWRTKVKRCKQVGNHIFYRPHKEK